MRNLLLFKKSAVIQINTWSKLTEGNKVIPSHWCRCRRSRCCLGKGPLCCRYCCSSCCCGAAACSNKQDTQLREYARNRSRQWPVLGVYVSAVKLLQGNPDIGHYSAKEKKLLQTGLTRAFSHSHPHRCVYIWLWYLCHNVVFSFPIVNWRNNVEKTSCWPITEISHREERRGNKKEKGQKNS